MTRLFWFTLALGLGLVLLVGGSWAVAYNSLGTLLGEPPPQMGTQSTSFLWRGMPHQRGHPRVWSFAFSPTRIPGAPSVRVYITPTGHIVQTEPADLAIRLRSFHMVGYQD